MWLHPNSNSTNLLHVQHLAHPHASAISRNSFVAPSLFSSSPSSSPFTSASVSSFAHLRSNAATVDAERYFLYPSPEGSWTSSTLPPGGPFPLFGCCGNGLEASKGTVTPQHRGGKSDTSAVAVRKSSSRHGEQYTCLHGSVARAETGDTAGDGLSWQTAQIGVGSFANDCVTLDDDLAEVVAGLLFAAASFSLTGDRGGGGEPLLRPFCPPPSPTLPSYAEEAFPPSSGAAAVDLTREAETRSPFRLENPPPSLPPPPLFPSSTSPAHHAPTSSSAIKNATSAPSLSARSAASISATCWLMANSSSSSSPPSASRKASSNMRRSSSCILHAKSPSSSLSYLAGEGAAGGWAGEEAASQSQSQLAPHWLNGPRLLVGGIVVVVVVVRL